MLARVCQLVIGVLGVEIWFLALAHVFKLFIVLNLWELSLLFYTIQEGNHGPRIRLCWVI